MPISNESRVPDTAPAANSTPIALAQVWASPVSAGFPRLYPRHSAKTVISGKAIPKQEKMMCQPSDRAICIRAGYRFSAASATNCNGSTPTSAPGWWMQDERFSGQAVSIPDSSHPVETARQRARRSGEASSLGCREPARARLLLARAPERAGSQGCLMTEPTDTFAELARRGHQVFTAAARAWEDAARSMVEAARRPGERLPDVRASLDAAFEFAAQMLAEQREFAKTVMAAGAGALAAERTVPDDGPGTAERSDVRPYATPGTPAVEKPAETGEPDRQDDTTVPTEPPALPPAAED